MDATTVNAIVLLAALLCAEAPGGDIEERWLIAQTVTYRAHVGSLPIDAIIYEPHQYPGVGRIDLLAYMRTRCKELSENIQIASAAVLIGHPTVKVSNFARTGTCWHDQPCEWERRCKVKVVAVDGGHTFYLCPDWSTKEDWDAAQEIDTQPRHPMGAASRRPHRPSRYGPTNKDRRDSR